MSAEARTWAKRARAPSPPAKSVLCALADYAGDQDFAYAAIRTLASDTQYSARQVQRLLAELVGVGLLVRCDMIDKQSGRTRTCAYFFPITATRPTEKMVRDIEMKLGGRVTQMSPSPSVNNSPNSVDKPVDKPRGEGDAGVTLPPDIYDRGRVSRLSPLELDSNPERTEVLSSGARADEAFAELVNIWPPAGIDNTDVPAAKRAFSAEAAKVGDPLRIVGAARSYLSSAEFKARTYAPAGLDRWLSRQSYLGRLPAVAAPRLAGGGSGLFGDQVPDDVRAAVLAARGEGFVGSYLDPCAWDGGERSLRPATRTAAAKLAEIKQLLSELNVVLAEYQRGVA